MTLAVVVRFRFEGVHSWPDCPLQDVAFLRDPHRHEFHVEAVKLVEHEDRDVEIIMLKRAMQVWCQAFRGPHTMSCESMARQLVDAFLLQRCRVLEDGENGAEVTA